MQLVDSGIVERSTPTGRRREIDVTDRPAPAVRELVRDHDPEAEVWFEHRPDRTLLVSERGAAPR